MTKNVDFGEAIKALKNGKKVAREGWNGKGMFLYYVPAASYPAMTEIAKAEWGGECACAIHGVHRTEDGSR